MADTKKLDSINAPIPQKGWDEIKDKIAKASFLQGAMDKLIEEQINKKLIPNIQNQFETLQTSLNTVEKKFEALQTEVKNVEGKFETLQTGIGKPTQEGKVLWDELNRIDNAFENTVINNFVCDEAW
ncbi:MAG: hypothetical protein QWI36_00950 [Wolbachia endosymbiont of Tyrophagus putrescentiae]|nr:hypothetical protein [Wolbachia endosymbiont of Tyrophagus putrescentiae]